MVGQFKPGDNLRVVSFWPNREYAPHPVKTAEHGSNYRFSKHEYFELADGPW